MSADVFEYIRQGIHGLKRDAWHRIQHGLVAETALIEAENHYRGGAVAVDDDVAGIGNHCLLEIAVQNVEPAGVENPPHLLVLTFVKDVSL